MDRLVKNYPTLLPFQNSQGGVGVWDTGVQNRWVIIKFLAKMGKTDPEAVYGAIAGGHLKMVRHLYQKGDVSAVRLAARYNQVKILKFFHKMGEPFTLQTMLVAVTNGHLPTVKYLRSVHTDIYSQTMDEAAYAGHLEMVKYLHSINVEINCPLMQAAGAGHLDVIEFLWSVGVRDDKHWAMEFAVTHGHVEIAKYFYHRGGQVTRQGMVDAVVNGHLEMVKYLYLIRMLHHRLIDVAAGNGHLEIVEYLHGIGQGIDRWTIGHAEFREHFHVVEYLKANSKEG